MLPIVMIVISIVAVLILGTFAFMVVNVLREGPSKRPYYDHRWRWRPPIAGGAELMSWASKVAETVTQKLVSQKRGKATPTQIAEEVLTGATFAINHVPSLGVDSDEGHCRAQISCRMGVTAPEVLAIADQLRGHHDQARQVHDLAATNARRIAQTPLEEQAGLQLACPLVTSEGSCVAHKLRPVACRANCHLEGLVESPENARALEQVARELGEGVEAGLAQGLKAAGLDGRVYEFNSALAVALEIPDASERWARGEDVLGRCALYQPQTPHAPASTN